MKSKSKSKSKLAYASIVLAALTACGGGGGGSTETSTAPTPTPTPTTGGGTLATTVPTPTYAAGSTQLAMFNQLNDVRLKGGFGMLAQDPVLDAAATNHAKYNIANYYVGNGYYDTAALAVVDPSTGWLTGHVESSSKKAFTGILPIDRAKVAGATYQYIGEVVSWSNADCVGWFLNSVFHRSALLNTVYQNIGLANVVPADGGGSFCVIDPGYTSSQSVRPTGWTGVYPGIGQTGVDLTMAPGEIPNPAPSIPDAQKGLPISVYLNSDLVKVNAFTVSATGAQTNLPTIQLDASTFPANLTKREVYILPTAPLTAKTTYKVNFSASLADGTLVEKQWSFATK